MASLVELALPEIEYPESDGQPIGETDFHITATLAKIIELQKELERLRGKKTN